MFQYFKYSKLILEFQQVMLTSKENRQGKGLKRKKLLM